MRIAFQSASESLIVQLGKLSQQQSALQTEVTTGRRVSRFGDDPTAMSRVLAAQSDNSKATQYRSNIASLQDSAKASYTAIDGLQTIADRAAEIATLADGTKSTDNLGLYAVEVNQLIEQAVQVGNTQYQGEYIFGGTASDATPFVTAKDGDGNITAVTYQGNTSVASAEIAEGTTVSAWVPGANTSGSGATGLFADSRNGSDFFAHLIALRDHLNSGDVDAISSTDQAALVNDQENITLQMSANGLLQSQLEAADGIASAHITAAEERVSQDADADLVDVLTRLSATQTAYQAALQSGASLLQQSQTILDYLS